MARQKLLFLPSSKESPDLGASGFTPSRRHCETQIIFPRCPIAKVFTSLDVLSDSRCDPGSRPNREPRLGSLSRRKPDLQRLQVGEKFRRSRFLRSSILRTI